MKSEILKTRIREYFDDGCPDGVLSDLLIFAKGALEECEKENARLRDALKTAAVADHPAITDMDNAEELGRRLVVSARADRAALAHASGEENTKVSGEVRSTDSSQELK
jgi:hypothetical protein